MIELRRSGPFLMVRSIMLSPADWVAPPELRCLQTVLWLHLGASSGGRSAGDCVAPRELCNHRHAAELHMGASSGGR